MATNIIMNNPGQSLGKGDELKQFLTLFAGETLEAFERKAKVMDNHIVRSIESGKSAQFPIFGRAVAKYLKPGMNLDDLRENIPHNERLIHIDGLLTSDQMISDLYEKMSHFDSRQAYARQMGESLAISADGALLAEIAKMVESQEENAPGLGKGTVIEKTAPKGINEAYGLAIVEALMELKATFANNYVPDDDRFVYMTPEATSALVASSIAINRDYGAIATIVEGKIDRLLGFKIIEVPHLTVGGADKTGMIGTSPQGHEFPVAYKEDIAFLACHRTGVGTLKLDDFTVEQTRRGNYKADEITASYAMGHGGLRPEASAVCLIKAGKAKGK